MRHGLWRLPGPAAWLRAVLEDFDDGMFLLLRLPRTCAAAELMEAVRDARPAAWIEAADISDGGSVSDELRAIAQASTSVDDALDRFNADGTVPWIRVNGALTAAAVAPLAEAHGRVAAAPARAVVIEHLGVLEHARRLTAPTLRVHALYGALSTLDTLVLLHDVAPALTRVRREEVAELAAHDMQLAADLAATEPPTHERYVELCRSRADALEITGHRPHLPNPAQMPTRQPGSVERDWQSGALDVFDGQPIVHPGIADAGDVERRLWRAEVRTMLPFLDEMRLALIEATRARGLFILPGRGDTVELVDLLRALEHRGANDPLTRAARELTRARNDLAHLRLVDDARRRKLSESLRVAGLTTSVRL